MHRTRTKKMIEKGLRILGVVAGIFLIMVPVISFSGTLEAPSGPTMQGPRHTVKDIYNRLKFGWGTGSGPWGTSTGLSGGFVGPSGGIAATLWTTPSNNTLNDIYDAAPKPDNAGAGTAQVCSGKKYFSLLTAWTTPTGTWGAQTGSFDCNRRPVAVNDSFSVNENATLVGQNIISNDTDADGDPRFVSDVTTGDAIGQVSSWTTSTISYSPNNQFNHLAAGQSAVDSFRYTVSDGKGGTDVGTVKITINGVDSPPTIPSFADPYLTVSEDSVGVSNVMPFPVTRVDKDLASLTYTITQNGSRGIGTKISSSNAFIYVPNADANGSDSIKFTACNGTACSAETTVNITLNAVNDPPSFDLMSPRDQRAAAGSGTTNVNNFATNISTGPSNESGQSLTGFTVAVTSDPSNVLTATPTITTGGRLSYSVHATNTGVAQLSVTLTDDGGGNDTSPAQVFSITVY